jgi:hypothetical protein
MPACYQDARLCGGDCVSLTNPNRCGPSCASCGAVPNGAPACDGLSCSATCPLPLPDGGVSLDAGTPAWDCDGLASNGCESATRCTLPITNGLVAEYLFSGNTNNTAGSGSGTVVGATLTTDRKGQAASAYAFVAASAQYISFGSVTGLPSGKTPRSVSLWYRGTPSSPYQSLLNWGTANSDARFGISLGSSGTMFFTGQYDDVYGGSQNVADGQWHHLAVTWNGALIAVYLDGRETGRGLGYPLNTSSGGLVVGKKVDTNGEYGNGAIDDIRIYNRTLTGSEIEALSKE